MDVVAMKRMEDFAKTMLNANSSQQKKIWESLEQTLTKNEISGLKQYVGLFHMFHIPHPSKNRTPLDLNHFPGV